MTTLSTLSDDSLAALKRDHERLRYEVQALRVMLRSFISSAGDRGMRPFCRFTLVNVLDVSEEYESATITHQLGDGRNHPSTSITVFNLGTHLTGTYVFQGDAGDAGWAFYHPDVKRWYIFQMECP